MEINNEIKRLEEELEKLETEKIEFFEEKDNQIRTVRQKLITIKTEIVNGHFLKQESSGYATYFKVEKMSTLGKNDTLYGLYVYVEFDFFNKEFTNITIIPNGTIDCGNGLIPDGFTEIGKEEFDALFNRAINELKKLNQQ